MKNRTIIRLGAFALLSLCLVGSKCPSIPGLDERVVDLVLGKSTTLDFHAEGSDNDEDGTQIIDVNEELDLAGVDIAAALDDAGIDLSDADDIFLTGVSYRTKVPDAEPTRAIADGFVEINIGGIGPMEPLVENFNESVNGVTTFKTAQLNSAGVDLINSALRDYLDALKEDRELPGIVVSYHWQGRSEPVAVPTDFIWELKLDIEITGTVTVDVLS